jgi:opacity protein-like surface antigen
MRRLARRVVVVAVAAMVGPSVASAENFYAAVRGGPGITGDTDRQSLLGGDTILEFKTGFTGSGALGYAFPFGLRAEAEFGYLYSPLERHLEQEVGGAIKSYLAMANVYYDVKLQALGSFRPFVGFGIGGARVNNDHQIVFSCTVCQIGGTAPKLDVDEWRTAFAYQARGGVIYDVNQWLDLSLGYRYVHIDGGHVGPEPRPLRINVGPIDNHSVELGFAIKF